MMQRTAFASLLALALASGAARAQASLDAAAAGNVLGGGVATLSGGGDNSTLTYSTGGAGGGGGVLLSQPGRFARFAGSHGDGQVVEYLAAAASADPGREAWMVGGGDNTEVVYGPRR